MSHITGTSDFSISPMVLGMELRALDYLGSKGKHYTPEFPFSNLQNEVDKTQAWA